MAFDDLPSNLQPPEGIVFGVSKVDKRRTGCFALNPITKGAEFGPYAGRIVYNKEDDSVDPKFSWEVFDLKTFKYLHTVDATNPNNGNWMRYVCCARYFEEQNIVSTQNDAEVFYRALKDIKAGEELLTWFQPKKKKRKKSLIRHSTSMESLDGSETAASSQADYQRQRSTSPSQSTDSQKRQRKPKVIPDAYVGPLDWEVRETKEKKVSAKDDEFEPLQPGQKRRRRKKQSVDTIDSSTTSRAGSPSAWTETSNTSNAFEELKPNLIKIEECTFPKNTPNNKIETSSKSPRGRKKSSDKKKKSAIKEEKNDGTLTNAMSITEINNSVEWDFPSPGEEYTFRLKKHHIVAEKGKKVFKCDICLGLYKHMFSLKRHYLRNHINYKYVSKADMANCLINLAQVKQQMAKYENLELTGVKSEFLENEAVDDNQNEKLGDRVISDKNMDNTQEGQVCEEEMEEDNEGDNGDRDAAENETLDGSQTADDLQDIDEEFSDNKDCSLNGRSTDSSLADDIAEYERTIDRVSKNQLDHTTDNEVNETDNENALNGAQNSEEDSKITDFDSSKTETYDDIENGQSDNNRSENCEENKNNLQTVQNSIDRESNKTLESKKKKVLKPGLYKCYTCYMTFDDFPSIQEHTLNHPEQKDGACFACDLCSMRFNYKHNLLRHRNNHSKEAPVGVKFTPKKQSLLVKQKKPLLLPSVFRCGACPLKFDTQPAIMKHVAEQHKTSCQFQCPYCAKEFLSQPNMKKHVRFHLGYRATCRICSEAFSNVGALRKHTRVTHPDAYKAKLIERLEKYGALKGPDKNALSAEIGSKTNGKEIINKTSGKKTPKLSENSAESSESIKKVKEVKGVDKQAVDKQEKTVEKEETIEEFDNDINFTADEIDDGGSRFKFACTVCKKRFSSYINMCRHRRKVHTNENHHRTEQCLTFGRKPRNNPSPVSENALEVAAYFANVSHNIATNLNCYLDGKQESLKTFAEHIKVEDYRGNFGYCEDTEKPVAFSWERYNFPKNYKPAETISFADIKNVLNIHNDFDSHCVAVDSRNTDSDSDLIENKKTSTVGVKLVDTKSSKVSTETDHSTAPDETNEDLEVREINKLENQSLNNQSETVAMGKSAPGLKVLATLGSALSKKGMSQADSKKKEDKTFLKLRIADGLIMHAESPATKTFHQVKLGEYTNFQDDLDCHMDSPIHPRTNSTSSARSWKERLEQKRNRQSPNEATKSLVKTAQDQIEALYESIDNCEPVQNTIRKSPPSLSTLCEQILRIRPAAKDQNRNPSNKDSPLTSDVASHLMLSTSVPSKQSVSQFGGPDYSDAPEESPFYNYDSIAFGKHGPVEQVCAVCRKHFSDFDMLVRHHMKKHPASECSFLEVEKGNDIDDLHFSSPSCVGVLAVTDPGLDDLTEMDSFKCTNCGSSFKSVGKLHVHIVNCSSIDPVLGVLKAEKSLSKSPTKKKLHKKFMGMFHTNDGKSNLFQTKSQQAEQRISTPSQKRVFTGCRKRTSFILPDSPIKVAGDQKMLQSAPTGYNPHNHVRRRELTEVLDTLTCEACGLKFNTIIVLERHVKYCTKKEKFKTIQPMACHLIDETVEKIKNACPYCNKNFTYTKSLLNHFQDFCPVKRAKLDNSTLTEEDKLREQEICVRIQKAEDEKIQMKLKEVESRPKRKITWQVGRKSKRKGHAWTTIKKRNQNKSIGEDDSQDDGEAMQDSNYDVFESEKDDRVEDESIGAENMEMSDLTAKGNRLLDNGLVNALVDTENAVVNDSHVHLMAENTVETENNSSNGIGDNSIEEHNEEIFQDRDVENIKNDDIDQMVDCKAEEELSEAVNSILEDNSTTDLEEKNKKTKKFVDVNNTSLNCTARYKVNHVHFVKSHKHLSKLKKGKQTKKIFHSISKVQPQQVSATKHDTNLVHNEEVEFQLAQQGLITGKRKRERVGKVEEFLRNAFRRKRKKQELDSGDLRSSSNLFNKNASEILDKCVNLNSISSRDNLGLLEVKTVNRTVPAVEKSKTMNETDSIGLNGVEKVVAAAMCDQNNMLNSSEFVSLEPHCGMTPSSNLNTTSSDDANSQTIMIGKKRGRPPKKTFAGRGRPRLQDHEDTELNKIILPRGRPRIHKIQEEKVLTKSGLPRGRPRKDRSEQKAQLGIEVYESPEMCKHELNNIEEDVSNLNKIVEMKGSQENYKHETEEVVRQKIENNPKRLLCSKVEDKTHDQNEKLEGKDLCDNNVDNCVKTNGTYNYEHNENIKSSSEQDTFCIQGNAINIPGESDKKSNEGKKDSTDISIEKIDQEVNENRHSEASTVTNEGLNAYKMMTDQHGSCFLENKVNNSIISNLNGTPRPTEMEHINDSSIQNKQHSINKCDFSNKNHNSFQSYDEVDGGESSEGPHLAFHNEKSFSSKNAYLLLSAEVLNDSERDTSKIEDLQQTVDELQTTENYNFVGGKTRRMKVEENTNNLKEKHTDIQRLRNEIVQVVTGIDNEFVKLDNCQETREKERDVNSKLEYSGQPEMSDKDGIFEPVLSPSERVKMNKRSCKRDVDLTSPVWVKRTQLNSKGDTIKREKKNTK